MNEEELKNRAREKFENSVDAIDGETASRITQTRNKALAHQSKKSWFNKFTLYPATVMASITLAVMLFLNQSDIETEPAAMDIDLISSSEELEMIEELDFYVWLDDYALPS